MPVSLTRPYCLVPDHSFSQEQIRDWMVSEVANPVFEARVLRALYRDSGIRHRFSVMDAFRTDSDLARNWDSWSSSDRMKLYRQEAIPLGKRAVEGLLKEQPHFQKPTHLIWVSCTGLMAPGPEILLALSLGLPPETRRMAVNFMGCHGFFHALRMAQGIVALEPLARVVVVCVELCTLHFKPAQTEDQLLSNALFGDGAAAIGISAAGPNEALVCQEQVQFLTPDGGNSMAWDLGEAGFEMKLARSLPQLIEGSLHQALSLFSSDVSPHQLSHYVFHPGGKRILDSLQRGLNLPDSAMSASRKALAEVGNVSSAAVLFALQKFLDAQPGPGHGLLLGVGPGITLEAARFLYKPIP